MHIIDRFIDSYDSKDSLIPSQLQQAYSRILFGTAGLIYLWFHGQFLTSYETIFLASAILYFIYNCLALYTIRKTPRSVLRMLFGPLLDVWVVSLGMMIDGGQSSGLYLVFFIIIFGNAVRFGNTMLLYGQTLSIIGIISVSGATLFALNLELDETLLFLQCAALIVIPAYVIQIKKQASRAIRAKREDGRLRQFNLSLLVTDEFMQAVINDEDWRLAFPVTPKEVDDDGLDVSDSSQFVWRDWPEAGNYVQNDAGLVACKVYKTLPARRVWDVIMASTYDFAEPGFVLIDKVNEMNNNWFCENIRATNPCGEQPLPPYGSCLLGSINLTRFVEKPFSDEATFDWDNFRKVVKAFTRMLDNVVEINGLPLPQQRNEIQRKRRHGMGFLGLGSTITMLRMKYGEAAAVEFTEEVAKQLALAGWEEALELSKEKGPAPIMNENFEVTEEMLGRRPEMKAEGYHLGDKVPGRILHAKYSRYMQRIAAENPELVEELARSGARFTHHSSIAPTGTISLSLANNASNGIEPSFAHHYFRNVIRQGKKSKEKVDVFSFELLAYRGLVDADAMPAGQAADAAMNALPDYFITADEITPKQHVDIQAAAQKWIDSSISKTANVPTDYAYDEFKDIYLYAYKQGLKGCTTFRFNPEAFQGVLVKEKDLQNTTYSFTLEDGSSVELKGDEEIEYDGEVHTAANLFDALKEGYYGKF